MPPKRKTTNLSPTTIHRWLRIYMVELHRMVKVGDIHPDCGKKAAKGLNYAIKALEESYSRYKAEQRRDAADEFESARKALLKK